MENYPIFVLQNELEAIKKRLDSDVIVDPRFKEEIEADKIKVKQLKRSIDVLKAGESVNIADLSIKAINRVEVINENGEIQPSCLGAVVCCFFGHKYRLKRHITPYLREIKCTRCKKEFGMNDQTQSVLPLDDKLIELHRVLK